MLYFVLPSLLFTRYVSFSRLHISVWEERAAFSVIDYS